MSTILVSPMESQPVRVPLRWYAIWLKALVRPTVGNYENLLAQPNAGFGRALLWIILAGIAGGLLSTAIYPGFLNIDQVSGNVEWYFGLQFDVMLLGWLIFAFYLTLQHGTARLLAGAGGFAKLAFLSAAYTSPLILVSAVLSGISTASINAGVARQPMEIGFHPVAQMLPDTPGWFFGRNAVLTLLLFLFSFVAVRTVYRLQAPNAFLVVLVPTLLAACAVSGFTGFMWVSNLPQPKKLPYAIYLMDSDGSHLSRLTDNNANDIYPAWSPDGKRIAFTSDRAGNYDIYIINVDGTGLQRLTDSPANDSTPVWSPDAKRIAFTSDRDGNFDIYVMNSDGSNLTRLTTNPADDGDVAWSPDGRQITFGSYPQGNEDIFVMNMDGSQEIRLTNFAANDDSPTWSPDGKHIAFGSNHELIVCYIGQCPDEGPSRIWVMNADGTDVKAITAGEADDLFPAWSPDGVHIAFVSDRDGNDEIYVMDLNGGAAVNLTNNPDTDTVPSWSPDGKRLVFASQRP